MLLNARLSRINPIKIRAKPCRFSSVTSLALVALICTTLLPNFNQLNYHDSIFYHALTWQQRRNSVAPDQLASQKPADLDLQFSNWEISNFSVVRVNPSPAE